MGANPQPITTFGTAPPLMIRPTLHPVERPGSITPKPGVVRRPRKRPLNVTERIKYLIYGKKAFCLRRAITLKTSREGGRWVHSYKAPGISVYGRTKLDALSAFAMELSSAWHWIAEQPDETLAPDALELKRKPISLVASVMANAKWMTGSSVRPRSR